MPLQPGAQLGDFEIVSVLGAGGMGEVYRARDTKLSREVAIKTLLEEVSANPDRLARFEREARVLASLNHANIATLHGFFTAGEVSFLVMELVEGETLAERIAAGPLPVDEAIPLFREIAEGLAAAHAKGVVHRDLKPANIKVLRGDGSGSGGADRVKLLDFGLAKALAPETTEGGQASASLSPTLTLAATQRGEILGTAAYMAPEQARGLPVDARADIWAFGVCLLESLTGLPVFDGEDASTVLASVLKDEPNLDRLPPDAPTALRRLLRRCLVKQPGRRLRDISDARLELEEAEDPSLVEDDRPRAEPAAERESGRRKLLVGSIAAATVVLAAFLGWQTGRGGDASAERPHAVRRVAAQLASDPPFVPAGKGSIAIAPDGSALAYRTVMEDRQTGIYYRRFDRSDGRIVYSTVALVGWPAFSPAGNTLVFGSQEGLQVKQVRLDADTAPVDLAPSGAPGTGAALAADGTLYFSNLELRRIVSVARPGAPLVDVTAVAEEAGERHVYPQLLDGDRLLLFTRMTSSGSAILLRELASGETTTLLERGERARYAPPGHLVFESGGSLWAVAFDLQGRRTLGEAALVLRLDGSSVDPQSPLPGESSLQWDLSESGDLLVATGGGNGGNGGSELVWVDRQGRESPTGARTGLWRHARLAPSGDRVAVAGFGRDSGVWLLDLERGSANRVTEADSQPVDLALWSANGASLLYTRSRPSEDFQDVLEVAADGATRPELLIDDALEVTGGREFVATFASRDGHWVLGQYRKDAETHTALFDRETGRLAPLDLGAGNFVRNAELSPDARFVVFQSDRSGRDEVYVRPFPDVVARLWTVSTEGGRQPAWSPKGDEIFFVGEGGSLMAVSVHVDAASSDLVLGLPEPVFAGPYTVRAVGPTGRAYDVAPDAGRFLVSKLRYGEVGSPIVLIENFIAEVERLVPAP